MNREDEAYNYALTRQIAPSYTIQVLPREAVKEQQARYEKLLDSLGEASLSATKAFLAERAADGADADSYAEAA